MPGQLQMIPRPAPLVYPQPQMMMLPQPGVWAAHQQAMARPMPMMAPRMPLPTAETIGDWTRYRDAQGQPYYHNPKLGKTQWEPPDEFKKKPTNPAEQWVEYNTGDKKYYVNVLTGMSTFIKPASIIESEKKAEEIEKK